MLYLGALLFGTIQFLKLQSLTFQMIGIVSQREVVARSGLEVEYYDYGYKALFTIINSYYC